MTCGVLDLFGECEQEAVSTIVGGCRHEHVKERPICAHHLAGALDPETYAGCRECLEDGHDCRVTFREVTR